MTDEVITALEAGKEPYPIDKLEAHRRPVRHLAVSLFVFDGEGRLLVQQRAAGKYHSPGLWANSVCTHPRWNESVADCARRRIVEELGWSVPLQEADRLEYSAPVGDLHEHEVVHCFFGHAGDEADTDAFNRDEVQAVEWLGIEEIARGIEARPQAYTPWFRIYMAEHRDMLETMASRR